MPANKGFCLILWGQSTLLLHGSDDGPSILDVDPKLFKSEGSGNGVPRNMAGHPDPMAFVPPSCYCSLHHTL